MFLVTILYQLNFNFREIRVQRGCGTDFKSTKLAPNFFPKKAYVTHLRNLQFCLSEGVQLVKVRRAIRFNQKAWIAPYIAENTRLRQQATDEFERDYYKLLNNAFFGKHLNSITSNSFFFYNSTLGILISYIH